MDNEEDKEKSIVHLTSHREVLELPQKQLIIKYELRELMELQHTESPNKQAEHLIQSILNQHKAKGLPLAETASWLKDILHNDIWQKICDRKSLEPKIF